YRNLNRWLLSDDLRNNRLLSDDKKSKSKQSPTPSDDDYTSSSGGCATIAGSPVTMGRGQSSRSRRKMTFPRWFQPDSTDMLDSLTIRRDKAAAPSVLL
ncbi:hypothetical protein E4U53_005654, partial [Claviceps sorghi]